jgi:acyl-CoA thioesterase I
MKSVLLTSLLAYLALGQTPDSRPVIVAFGDSMTAGFGVAAEQSYPAQLQKSLDALGYKYRVVNMGVSGDTTNGGRTRLSRALAANPVIVILELGANDRSNGISQNQTEENLGQIITTLQKTHIGVVLAGRTQTGLENVYADLAGKYKLTLIPSFLAGVSGNPDLTISDMTHPNGDGYAIVVKTVLKAIEPRLRK